jgi:replicative DNA helicase
MERSVPYDLQAERATLGAILLDATMVERVADWLTPSAFHLQRHDYVFGAMLACYARREPPDLTTVAAELRRHEEGASSRLEAIGGLAYLMDLTTATNEPYRVEAYARTVERTAKLRQLIEAGGEIAALGFDESSDLRDTLDAAEQRLHAVTRNHAGDGFVSIAAAVQTRAQQYADVLDGEAPPGITTGLRSLDALLGGFKPGQLVAVGARPGVGKTALLLSIARYQAKTLGQRVGVFSLEMSREELVDRLVAMETGYDLADIRNHRVRGPAAEGPLYSAFGEVGSWPVDIDDTPGIPIATLRARARALHRRSPLGCLFVDYLQLIGWGANDRNENEALTVISKGLKALARELEIPIVTLAQLNRNVEGRSSHVPTLADFRGSGSVEQDADVVIFPYREEMHERESAASGTAELHIAKQRNGPRGVAACRFDAARALFCNLDERQKEARAYGRADAA